MAKGKSKRIKFYSAQKKKGNCFSLYKGRVWDSNLFALQPPLI